jgi:di/tricarboxylate transporter
MSAVFAIALPNEWKIGLVLSLLVVAIVLFAMEKLSVDLITLILLLALIGTHVLSPADAFAGFSEEIIIMLGSIFVIGGALQATGVVDALAAKLIRLGGNNETRFMLVLLIVCCGLSAFMNNTTVIAMLVGPVTGLARKRKLAPSKILMPMAYASILGGTCTLIGTSTNMAVSGFIAREQMKPLGLFEFTPIGLIIAATGITYLMTLGRRLLPAHHHEREDVARQDYLSEIVVLPDSRWAGQKPPGRDLSKMEFRILKVRRNGGTFIPDAQSILRAGDVLLVTSQVEKLVEINADEGIEIKTRLGLDDRELQRAHTKIAEVVVMPRSDLVGSTLESLHHEQPGLTVLGVHPRKDGGRESLGAVRVEAGDLLLVQADEDHFNVLKSERELAVVDELGPPVLNRRKALYVTGFFLAALAAGGFEWLPTSVCFLAAAVLAVLFRCITIKQAYESIDWRLLILIGGMTAFGVAIERTGAAAMLAQSIVGLLGPFGVMPILVGFFVLTIILTQPMSNAAAALVVLPVALESARKLGVNERTFAIAIMLAASISFITPFEPSCILVYGPGKYRFLDFVKTGALLTLILAIIVLILIPHFWPLHPVSSHGTGTK